MDFVPADSFARCNGQRGNFGGDLLEVVRSADCIFDANCKLLTPAGPATANSSVRQDLAVETVISGHAEEVPSAGGVGQLEA